MTNVEMTGGDDPTGTATTSAHLSRGTTKAGRFQKEIFLDGVVYQESMLEVSNRLKGSLLASMARS